jgi:hypothetical protein
MGTNYYRIPSEEEMQKRKDDLLKRIEEMDISASAASTNFCITNPDGWEQYSPWDLFTEGTRVHLGKRSGGWKFTWNFHEEEYYQDKATLEAYVRSGRVIDEYGEELTPDEFLEMAYNWCIDGWDSQTYYEEHPESSIGWIDYSKHIDRYVDGLRVFSSTDFC